MEVNPIAKLNVYVYGSCESDQYYHPQDQNQSRKPICLSAIKQFNVQGTIIPNPLLREEVMSIACGALHSIILTTEGRVYTFGCNDEGALGRTGPEKIPQQVILSEEVDLIAAGDNHSLFANSTSGGVFFTGNYKYLRGEKMTEAMFVPVRFTIGLVDIRTRDKNIEKVVSGANHSCILAGGKVFCRGEPEAYTTGRRINERRKTQSSLTFEGVGVNHVQDIWCGGYHTIVKTTQMRYYAWGMNTHGQLGINSFVSQTYPVEIRKLRNKSVKYAACGTNFSIFLMEDGRLWGCGQNQYGQMGRGKDFVYKEEQNEVLSNEIHEQPIAQHPIEVEGQRAQHNSPVQELKNNNYYIKSIVPIPLEEKASGISCGSEFVFAWSPTQLYSWGFGMNYVLLTGQEEDQYQPFKVRPTIIHLQTIHDLKAGAQHVLYLSHSSPTHPMPRMSHFVRDKGMESRKKMSRKKK